MRNGIEIKVAFKRFQAGIHRHHDGIFRSEAREIWNFHANADIYKLRIMPEIFGPLPLN
jgi:hypothetical protein